MIYIKRSGIDLKIRKEKEMRRQVRRDEDKRSGLTRTSECARCDFDYTKKLDKNLADYRNHSDSKDREKIKDEYFGRQKEYRDGAIKRKNKEDESR